MKAHKCENCGRIVKYPVYEYREYLYIRKIKGEIEEEIHNAIKEERCPYCGWIIRQKTLKNVRDPLLGKSSQKTLSVKKRKKGIE